jgi:hypothetical protein
LAIGKWLFLIRAHELVLHAICSTLGNAVPGIDDYWSNTVIGHIKLVDTHTAIESSYPSNSGITFTSDEFSATFNTDVDCDKESGNFWFNVNVSIN